MLSLLGASTAAHAQAETQTGITLFQEGTRFNLAYAHRERSHFFDGDDRTGNPNDARSRSDLFLLNLTYGVTTDLTAGMTAPYVVKGRDSNTGDLDDNGLGDASLSAKVRFYREDGILNSKQMAFILGLQMPTGRTGDLPERPVWPGSGAWNPFAAVAYSERWQRWDLDASAFYRWNTEGAEDVDASDELVLGVAGAYFPIQLAFPGPEFKVGLDLSWVHLFRERIDGNRVANSGGDLFWVSPFVGYAPRPDIVFEGYFGIPAYQRYEGTQLGEDWRVLLGFRWSF